MMESLEEEINRNIAMTEGGLLEEIHATATMVATAHRDRQFAVGHPIATN